jgi:hypothetical protein
VNRILGLFKRSCVVLIVIAMTADPRGARAQAPATAPAEAFGDADRFAAALSINFVSGPVDQLLGGATAEASYFIVPHLSAGLILGAFYQSNLATGSNTTPFESVTFRLGARVGYDLVIGDLFSVWFKLGPDFRFFHTSTTDSGAANKYSVAVALFTPFVVHPTRGFFLGFGPTLSIDLLNRFTDAQNGTQDVSKNVALGLAATIGGSF